MLQNELYQLAQVLSRLCIYYLRAILTLEQGSIAAILTADLGEHLHEIVIDRHEELIPANLLL